MPTSLQEMYNVTTGLQDREILSNYIRQIPLAGAVEGILSGALKGREIRQADEDREINNLLTLMKIAEKEQEAEQQRIFNQQQQQAMKWVFDNFGKSNEDRIGMDSQGVYGNSAQNNMLRKVVRDSDGFTGFRGLPYSRIMRGFEMKPGKGISFSGKDMMAQTPEEKNRMQIAKEKEMYKFKQMYGNNLGNAPAKEVASYIKNLQSLISNTRKQYMVDSIWATDDQIKRPVDVNVTDPTDASNIKRWQTELQRAMKFLSPDARKIMEDPRWNNLSEEEKDQVLKEGLR